MRKGYHNRQKRDYNKLLKRLGLVDLKLAIQIKIQINLVKKQLTSFKQSDIIVPNKK